MSSAHVQLYLHCEPCSVSVVWQSASMIYCALSTAKGHKFKLSVLTKPFILQAPTTLAAHCSTPPTAVCLLQELATQHPLQSAPEEVVFAPVLDTVPAAAPTESAAASNAAAEPVPLAAVTADAVDWATVFSTVSASEQCTVSVAGGHEGMPGRRG